MVTSGKIKTERILRGSALGFFKVAFGAKVLVVLVSIVFAIDTSIRERSKSPTKENYIVF